jgi:hypothetical protein
MAEKALLKPYDIVLVKHKDYRHYGEIISKPYEEFVGKMGIPYIQVRMVPGDPGTMQPFCIDNLRLADKEVQKYKWIQYAEVTRAGPGSVTFAVDMLRYDLCAPVNFTLNGSYEPILNAGEDKFLVARLTRLASPVWSDDRWLSFSWKIEHLKTIKFEKGK